MREENLPRLADTHIGSGHPDYLVYRRLIPELKSAARYAGGRLLDIGCGNKPYRAFFADRVTEYFGCDVVQSDRKLVDVICPANAIPLPDETFSTVLSTQTIEHVADYHGLLREAFRLLTPEGHLIISAPLYWPLHEEPHDFIRFTKYGLTEAFEIAGFETVSVRPNGGKWATCGLAFIHALAGGPLHRAKVVWMINKLFGMLDDRFFDPVNTMNYVAIARKPKPTGAFR